jgi:hypothetical protein
MRLALVVALSLALAGLAVALAPSSHHGHDAASASSRISRSAFHDAMRQLWEDHIVWTRMVIVSVIDGDEDASVALARLQRNQDDIGNAIKPFYGDAAGNALATLLHEHITGAGDLLGAFLNNDAAAIETATAAWYANGDAIGTFLADANPRAWDEAEMQQMMRDHLDLTLAEAAARLTADWEADVVAYDEIHRQILHMADMLSDGIVAQFPRSFSR